MNKILRLPVTREYFEEIKSGIKKYDYRLKSHYWLQRLSGRKYDGVMITLGYPAADDTSRILTFPWRGFECQTITHRHFGNKPVDVFAIKLER